MFKKSLAVGGAVAILSFALPTFAQASSGNCGFWANLFGQCSSSDQSANVLEARLGSTSRENNEGEGKMRFASTTSADIATQIQCVGSAVAVREASLGTAMTTYTAGLNSAYSTRASSLATAYTKTNLADLRAGIKTAWINFNASTKVAQKSWRTSKETAWNTFRTAVKACKASSSVTDSANAVTEMSGQ